MTVSKTQHAGAHRAPVGITAARRADEQAALVRAFGGEPILGPCIDLDRAAQDAAVLMELDRALAASVDVAVFMTGVGARHLMAVADHAGRGDLLRAALTGARVLARGAKARAVLRALDVRVDALADPPETRGVLAALTRDGSDGKRVLVQCAGPPPDPLVDGLARLGASVAAIHPYAISSPADIGPARALVAHAIAGRLAAITFTSANAVNGFAAIADQAECDISALPPRVLVTAVGPVTRQALLEHGMRVDVEPDTPRMGAMYHALAARLSAQSDAVQPLD